MAYLLASDKIYKKMTDKEKQEYIRTLVESVEIYDKEQEDGRFLKPITFCFPIFNNGEEVQSICLDSETTVSIPPVQPNMSTGCTRSTCQPRSRSSAASRARVAMPQEM